MLELLKPTFIVAFFPVVVMAYIAIVDPSVRQAFALLASSGITGFFGITVPQKKEENDAPSSEN